MKRTRRSDRPDAGGGDLGPRLLDERSHPGLRDRIGALIREAREFDVAIARFRLTGVDLGRDELRRVERCRLLVGRIDVGTFADASHAVRRDPVIRRRAAVLRNFASSGRVRVRAAGFSTWVPDFSVYRRGSGNAVVIVGAHYFAQPEPAGGPVLTSLLTDPDAAGLAAARFEELWGQGYDVLPVVLEALGRLREPVA